MPELPDIVIYLEALEPRILGAKLERVSLASPFLLRTVRPALSEIEGRTVAELRRVGKRIALRLEPDDWMVLHLMIAGRLHWYDAASKVPQSKSLAVFDFSSGSLTLTEAGTQHRAALHLVRGEDQLEALDPGGLEVLQADLLAFQSALTAHNHTLKRALTDPRIFSGIGNAYSDEILHRARLSPIAMTHKLSAEETGRLFQATRQTLDEWIVRLRQENGGGFPKRVTAFHEEMAVHGRYRQACPRCGTKVQRIRYASNETNYCPTCQTNGRVLADRALSRLLREDWPRTLEELEALTRRHAAECRSDSADS